MEELLPVANQIAELLIARKETIAVAESSAGGLISAALLSVPGASAYFLGGAVVYTRTARDALLGIPESALEGMRASTEPYALLLGPHRPRSLQQHVGGRRNRRDRTHRQPLRRCRRPCVSGRRWTHRTGPHARNGFRRPAREHARVRRQRVGAGPGEPAAGIPAAVRVDTPTSAESSGPRYRCSFQRVWPAATARAFRDVSRHIRGHHPVPSCCGRSAEGLLRMGASESEAGAQSDAAISARLAVKPWTYVAAPTGPISPLQNRPASGSGPSSSRIVRASWSGAPNRPVPRPLHANSSAAADGLDLFRVEHVA